MTLVKGMPVSAAHLVGAHHTRLWRVIQHDVEDAVGAATARACGYRSLCNLMAIILPVRRQNRSQVGLLEMANNQIERPVIWRSPGVTPHPVMPWTEVVCTFSEPTAQAILKSALRLAQLVERVRPVGRPDSLCDRGWHEIPARSMTCWGSATISKPNGLLSAQWRTLAIGRLEGF
jgi:hypothetical protein